MRFKIDAEPLEGFSRQRQKVADFSAELQLLERMISHDAEVLDRRAAYDEFSQGHAAKRGKVCYFHAIRKKQRAEGHAMQRSECRDVRPLQVEPDVTILQRKPPLDSQNLQGLDAGIKDFFVPAVEV